MDLNLNNLKQFTVSGVRRLIGSVEDDRRWQLRVSKTGTAYLADDFTEEESNCAFMLESWNRGNGYVGKEAANDDSWVMRIFNVLKKNWPDPTDTYIDVF